MRNPHNNRDLENIHYFPMDENYIDNLYKDLVHDKIKSMYTAANGHRKYTKIAEKIADEAKKDPSQKSIDRIERFIKKVTIIRFKKTFQIPMKKKR